MSTKKKIVAIQPQSGAKADINMTPLVDVVLVLLIIFMVVTPLIEKDVPIALPSTEKIEDVKEVPPDQVVVKVVAVGDMELNGNAVTTAQYVPALKEKLANRADKTVFIIAEDNANYAKLVAALDGARNAGAQTLGMAMPEVKTQ